MLIKLIFTFSVLKKSISNSESYLDEYFQKKSTNYRQEVLFHFLIWSVYAGYSDIAFVILLQIQSRMGAALTAAAIALHLSLSSTTVDACHKFEQQANDYEAYATECVNACYNRNKRTTCEILLREYPLFGNSTCMQVNYTDLSFKCIMFSCIFMIDGD